MASIGLILQGILAAIQAAPQVVEVITSAKNFISALAGAKVFTPEQQAALHSWVDAQAAMIASGITPPAWTVEPDPK